MTAGGYVFREHEGAHPAAPLLMLFHGTGGDENQFFALGRRLLPEARLVAPRGDVSENGALRYFRRTGEGVYDRPDLARRTDRMAAFVEGLGAQGPLYGLGYSNGANILVSVVLAHPHLFDAVVLMHPLIPWTPEDVPGLEGKSILVTAGRRDPLCPVPATETLAGFLARQGADVALAWHEGGHEIREAEIEAIAQFGWGADKA